MSKYICDICGTSYPDTASQCPVCGTAAPNGQAGAAAEEATATKTAVRGGRFSKSNVNKRISGKMALPPRREPEEHEAEENQPSGNKVVTVIVVLLLIAAMLVVGYIFLKFMLPEVFNPDKSTEPTSDIGGGPTDTRVPCTGITLKDSDTITFDMPGRAWLLNLTVEPIDTTDELTYSSSNEAVATVSETGRVVSVAGGVAVITIQCGDIQEEVTIICNFENGEPSDPSNPNQPTDPSNPDVDFQLKEDEFTLSDKNGLSWQIHWTPSSIKASDIQWTSSNTAVASVKDGYVTAHKTGSVTITAVYQGKTATCVVICSVENPTTPPDEGGSSTGVFTIQVNGITPAYGNGANKADCTFKLSKKSFRLTVVDKNDNNAKKVIDWKVQDESVCSLVDDGKGNVTVNLLKKGYTKITAEYEGVKYEIIVRVS